MIIRGVIAWLGIMVLAIANGALRELMLTPRLGARLAHQISTILLCLLILLVSWLLTPWMLGLPAHTIGAHPGVVQTSGGHPVGAQTAGARTPANCHLLIAHCFASHAWKIGGVWLGLTLAFEFLAGHYLFGNSWHKLLADYDVLAGRIWVFLPIVALISPRLALALQR